jgi:hypothetical protein
MEMRSSRGFPDAQLYERCIDWYAKAIERGGFESAMEIELPRPSRRALSKPDLW